MAHPTWSFGAFRHSCTSRVKHMEHGSVWACVTGLATAIWIWPGVGGRCVIGRFSKSSGGSCATSSRKGAGLEMVGSSRVSSYATSGLSFPAAVRMRIGEHEHRGPLERQVVGC